MWKQLDCYGLPTEETEFFDRRLKYKTIKVLGMKFKYYKNEINGPSHIERIWKLCYNRRKIIEFAVETSPHGYANALLIQFGGDAWFYKSLSVGNVLISFSFIPCV